MSAQVQALLSRLAGLSAAVGVGGWALSESLYNVDGGHSAIIWHRFNGGVQSYTLGEGTHFRIPFVTYPTIFDVRLRPRIVASRTGTKDLQQVQISLRILSRPRVEALPEIMINLGEDWDERVLPSIVNEVLKATVAQYDAEQLLTERAAVSIKIR
jgi:prohibitin 2